MAHHQQPVMIRDFDRLTLSVHYASTPSLVDKAKHKANSVEENSVNSEDCEISSSSSTSDHNHHHDGYHQNQRRYIQKQQQQQHYHPSNQSTASSNSTTNSSLLTTDSHNGVVLRNKSGRNGGNQLGAASRVASVSTSRLSSIVVNRNSQDLSKFQATQPFTVPQPQITTPNFPPPPPPVEHQEPQQQQQQQNDQQEPDKQDLSVTDEDVRAIDSCFRGHRTRVFVCGSLANLYTCPRASSLTCGSPTQVENWTLRLTGIPILLLDAGPTKPRKRRRIQIALVEKGTCFALWKDLLDNLSQYQAQSEAFHVMRLSRDHLAKIGLSFDCANAAEEFLGCLKMLTSDPANIALSGPAASGKARKLQRQRELEEEESARRYRPPSKAEISQPCGFQHVVRVDRADSKRYFSLQAYVDDLKKSSSQTNFSNGSDAQQNQHQQQRKLSVFNSCDELRC